MDCLYTSLTKPVSQPVQIHVHTRSIGRPTKWSRRQHRHSRIHTKSTRVATSCSRDLVTETRLHSRNPSVLRLGLSIPLLLHLRDNHCFRIPTLTLVCHSILKMDTCLFPESDYAFFLFFAPPEEALHLGTVKHNNSHSLQLNTFRTSHSFSSAP